MTEVVAHDDDAVARSNARRRRRGLWLLAAVLVVGAGAALLYWATIARYREYTDDAYVAGNLVQVTPLVGGTVISIAAEQTDLVERGDTLVQLNDADIQLVLDRAEAELGKAVREVSKLFASAAQYEAGVQFGSIALQRAQADLRRRAGLAEAGALSAEDLQHARETESGSLAGLNLVRAQWAGSRALIVNTRIERHPDVVAAATRVREAFLARHRTAIPSPVSGYVAKRNVQVGQRVTAGEPLLTIVPTSELWVEANFKEGQVRHLRIGQPVHVQADLYGDAVRYDGTVIGMGLGTGAAFALLPAQNATGNWIKVVQRLPVRIALDAEQLRRHPLRVGLSMLVTINTHQQDGAVLAQAPRANPLYRTTVYDNELHQADALIDTIIRANLGADEKAAAAGADNANTYNKRRPRKAVAYAAP